MLERPDDRESGLRVEFSAVIAREFTPEKMSLLGIEVLMQPRRVTAEFLIVDGKAVRGLATGCGRDIAFVG